MDGWDPLHEFHHGVTRLSATISQVTPGEHALDIPFWKLGLIVALLAFPLTVAGVAKLHVNRPLVIAGIRCLLQLLLLGGVLKAIFSSESFLWIAAYIVFMMTVASMEAGSRPKMSYRVRSLVQYHLYHPLSSC